MTLAELEAFVAGGGHIYIVGSRRQGVHIACMVLRMAPPAIRFCHWARDLRGLRSDQAHIIFTDDFGDPQGPISNSDFFEIKSIVAHLGLEWTELTPLERERDRLNGVPS